MTVAKLNEQLRAIDSAIEQLDLIETALFRKPDASKAISDEAGTSASTAIVSAKMQLEHYRRTIQEFMKTAKVDWPEI